VTPMAATQLIGLLATLYLIPKYTLTKAGR
jgi:hypothetical protein